MKTFIYIEIKVFGGIMESLREPFSIKSVDVRNVLNVAPSTMSEIYKKSGIDSENKQRGASKLLEPTSVRKVLEMKGFKYPKPAKVISFMMCKGGVGKSTSTFFIGQRLSSYGAKVLLIDTDSQGNLTGAFALDQYSYDFNEDSPVLVDLIENNANFEESIIAVTPNLHLLPSSPVNARLEGVLRDKYKNLSKPMKDMLEPIKSKYDFVLIDCAPALNLTNTANICASDLVILPVAPDKFSSLGVEQTISEIKTIENDFGVEVDKKIVFTRFDAREFTSITYLSKIASDYKDYMFSTTVRTSADCKNSITKKEDLFSYNKSAAKEDYDLLTQEIMGLKNFFNKDRKQDL